MSDENNKNDNRRYIGKIRNTQTKYGTMQKIYMDNLEPQNKDGTPNTYYKGNLVWFDAETNQRYLVKQMSVFVPRNGMSESDLKRGYSCYITLKLDDNYEVTVLA